MSLFQILLSNIAYNVVTEIIYLVGLIAISLIQTIFPIYLFKYITSICIFIILHILFVLLESVSQMYLTFWAKNKVGAVYIRLNFDKNNNLEVNILMTDLVEDLNNDQEDS